MSGVFRFATPIYLLLLVVPVVLLALPIYRRRLFTMRHTLAYPDTRLVETSVRTWRQRFIQLPVVLAIFTWMLLVLTLARPQVGDQYDILRGQGVDIVLVLDISTSMAALDFSPQNRLEAAKDVIRSFVDGRRFDRIGLVVFARDAYHQSPLTLDYDTLTILLDQVALVSELSTVQGRQMDGTAIGSGIASAANMLRQSESNSKVIILLTDGSSNSGLDPLLAAEAVAALGIRVYTIGMGTPGLVNVPTRTGDIVQLESDLDEAALREIAALTDGLYFRATDTEGLQQIYNQIDRLERSDVELRVVSQWEERADWFALPAFLLFSLSLVLRLTILSPLP